MISADYVSLILHLAIYSIIGWLIETAVCSVNNKRFVNCGFLYGPYCPIYGVGAVLVLLTCGKLAQYPPLVFLVAMVLTSALEYLTSAVMEHLFQIRWWDYSGRRFNLNGRVCLFNSLAFGALGLAMVYLLEPLVAGLLGAVAVDLKRSLASLTVIVLLGDMVLTLNALLKLSERVKSVSAGVHEHNAQSMVVIKARIEENGAAFRHMRSFPMLRLNRPKGSPMQHPGFYKLFWVFLSAGVIGFVVETIYCLAVTGQLTNRQGLLYGPFSQIYGFGAVLMVLILPRFAMKSNHWLFLGSALLGGTFEYLSSVFQEKTFHSISWEYSDQVMSIGGRTSLMYMIFWGILGYVFIKDIYPWLSNLIDRIPKRQNLFFSWILIVLLAVDGFLTCTALVRWHDRALEIPPRNQFAKYLDTHYPDDEMAAIYPEMSWVDGAQK